MLYDEIAFYFKSIQKKEKEIKKQINIDFLAKEYIKKIKELNLLIIKL